MASEPAPDHTHGDARRGLFDILARRSGRILLAFYGIWVLLAGLLAYARFVTAENPPLVWPEIAIISIVSAAITVGIALPLTFGLVEGTSMVLAELRKRLYRQEGREEGLEEAHVEWTAWNERRMAAEREGRPFTEPPPSRNGHNTRNGS